MVTVHVKCCSPRICSAPYRCVHLYCNVSNGLDTARQVTTLLHLDGSLVTLKVKVVGTERPAGRRVRSVHHQGGRSRTV